MWLPPGASLNMRRLAVMDFVVSLWLIGKRLNEHLLVSEHMATWLHQRRGEAGQNSLLFIQQDFVTYHFRPDQIKGQGPAVSI